MADVSPLYQPLDTSQGQFRLLKVLGVRGGVPHCQLRAASLQSDAITWNALSYRWGDDEATNPSMINDLNFPVRPNLYEFLLQLARNEERAWFFVDAICINQTDFAERNAQVQLMGEIYRGAQKVIVWILPDLESPLDLTFHDIVAAAIELIQCGPSIREDLDTMESVIIPAICVNSFWSRLWILQEVLLARRLEIWYANLKVSDTVISGYLSQDSSAIGNNAEEMIFLYISGHHELNAQASAAECELRRSRLALTILELRQQSNEIRSVGDSMSVHQAVMLSSTLQCQKLHDRAFGILGISSPCISVDYNSSLTELFIDMAADSVLSLRLSLALRRDERPRKFSEDFTFASLLASLASAFKLRMDDLLVLLVMQRVMAYFTVEFNDRKSYDTFLNIACVLTLGQNADGLAYSRRWYETRNAARRRRMHERESLAEAWESRLVHAQIDNQIILAPWLAKDGRSDARTYRSWVELIRIHCESIEKGQQARGRFAEERVGE